MRLLLSFLFLMMMSLPAMAAEFVYSPEGCEFRITFPDEPHAAQRCHDKLTDQCETVTGYTQVFGLDATLNFYVTCKPTEEDQRKAFTSDMMRTSLLARPGIDRLEAYDISYSDNEEAVMAALIGGGPSPNGQDVMIYIIQLWVGAKSVLTLEAELIGHDVPEADDVFAQILRSLHHKNWTPDNTGDGTAEPAPSAEDPPATAETAPETPETTENPAGN